MSDQALEHDELDDRPDPVDTAPAANRYDIRSEMDEDEKHLLDLLTDEELAALAEDDEAEDSETVQDGNEAPPEEAAPEPVEDAKAPPADQSVPQVDLTPEQIAEIEAGEKAAIRTALDEWRDGTLTDEELEARIDEAKKGARDAMEDAMAAILDQQAEAQFQKKVEAFQAEARTYLDANPGLKGTKEIRAYDAHVRAITGNPDFDHLNPGQVLQLAHRRYLVDAEALGLAAPPVASKADAKPKATPPAPAAPARKPRPDPVPTLARVPAAATNAAVDGEWAAAEEAFRRASPIEREQILMRMGPDKAEYFASLDMGFDD
jgi:hypothetical protein